MPICEAKGCTVVVQQGQKYCTGHWLASLQAQNTKLMQTFESIRAVLPSTKDALLEDTREEAIARLSLIFEDCEQGLKE